LSEGGGGSSAIPAAKKLDLKNYTWFLPDVIFIFSFPAQDLSRETSGLRIKSYQSIF